MAANISSNLASWSATAASNQPDTSDTADIVSDLQAIQAAVRRYMRSAATPIASGTTVDLSAADGDYVSITGTTTITGLGTVAAGMRFVLVFEGALTLTYNGTSLLLPGSANITTAAGDVVLMESLGSGNWKCLFYQPASGYQIKDADLTALAGLTSAANKIPMFSGSGTATVIDFKDEDNMASNSATAVPSQQSTKAYADTKNIATQVTPGTSGNVLTSNGSAWTSAAASSSSLLPKAWGTVNSAGTLGSSYGVSTVTRPSTGTYEITLSSAMADADYAIMCSCVQSGGLNHSASYDITSTTIFTVYTGYEDTASLDNQGFSFVIFN